LVLVLNADYRPLCIIGWQRAITLEYKHRENKHSGLEVVEYYQNDFIRGVNHIYPIPAVMRSHKYVRSKKEIPPFSRKNVYMRDNCSCMYCGNQFTPDKLTYDHVKPRSKGGKTEWTNIVTSCISCNYHKGNKTPEQAHMKLLKKPIIPTTNCTVHISPWSQIPNEWRIYINAKV